MSTIIIPDENSFIRYPSASEGQTQFSFGFVYFEKDDLRVQVNGVLLLQTDWTVAGVAESGGFNGGVITLNTGVSAGDNVVLYRYKAAERVTNLDAGTFGFDAYNGEENVNAVRDQDLQRDVGRALRAPIGESFAQLASAATRANKALAFGPDGSVFYAAFNTVGAGLLEAANNLSDVGSAGVSKKNIRVYADTIADLTEIEKGELTDGELARVARVVTGQPAFDQVWRWDAASTATADDVLTYEADEGGVGRWVLVVPADGSVSLYQGGALGNSNGTSGNGADDRAAIQRVFNACAGKYRVIVPAAKFRISDRVFAPSFLRVNGVDRYKSRIVVDYLGYHPGFDVANASFTTINDVGFDCAQDVRDLAVNITAITQANPAQVTANGHGLTTGQNVWIQGVGGMVELGDSVYAVTVIDANTVTLTGINSTGYTAFTSGGTIRPDYSGYGFSAVFIHDGSRFVDVVNCDFAGPFERCVEVLNSDHFRVIGNTAYGMINSFCRVDSDEIMATISMPDFPVVDTNILQPYNFTITGNRAHGGASWDSTTAVAFYYIIVSPLDNAADATGRAQVADNQYQYFQLHGINMSGAPNQSISITGNISHKIRSQNNQAGFALFFQAFLGGDPADITVTGNADDGSYESILLLGTSGLKIRNITFGANSSNAPVRNAVRAIHAERISFSGGSYCGATIAASAGAGDGMRFESCADIVVAGSNVCDNSGTSISSDSNCTGVHVIMPITEGNGTDAPSLGGTGNTLLTDANGLTIRNLTVSGTGINVRFNSNNANTARFDLNEVLGGYVGSPAADEIQMLSGAASGGSVKATATTVEINKPLHRGGYNILTTRYIDADLGNTPNSGDATTDDLLTAIKGLITHHGLGATAP